MPSYPLIRPAVGNGWGLMLLPFVYTSLR